MLSDTPAEDDWGWKSGGEDTVRRRKKRLYLLPDLECCPPGHNSPSPPLPCPGCQHLPLQKLLRAGHPWGLLGSFHLQHVFHVPPFVGQDVLCFLGIQPELVNSDAPEEGSRPSPGPACCPPCPSEGSVRARCPSYSAQAAWDS